MLASCASLKPSGEGHPVRVITYNVGGAVSGPTPPAVVATALRAGPPADVYVLQEIWSDQHLREIVEAIDRPQGSAFHTAYAPDLRLGIITREPLTACRAFHPSGSPRKYGAFRCELTGGTGTVPGGESVGLAVVGIHLEPIDKERDAAGFVRMGFVRSARAVLSEALLSSPRSTAVRDIVAWIDTWDQDALLVAGDFNTVPFTRTLRYMNRHFDEALLGTGDYLAGTYWKVDGRILPRIDFIFYSGSVERVNARVVEEKAGDHYPVFAEFVFR